MFYVAAILALGVLIVVHEAGHYFVARWSKMRVERFSVGFGPALLRWTSKKSGTQFQVAALPLGGFVQITGMNPHEEFDPQDPHVYPNRPTYQRFLTILAGPAMNYVLAIFMIFVVFMVVGTPAGTVRVLETTAGGAAAGKLMPQDRLLAVNGQALPDDGSGSSVFPRLVQESKGLPLTLKVLRDGKPVEVVITPKPEKVDDKLIYRVGIAMDISERKAVGTGTAIGMSLRYPIVVSAGILDGLKRIVTGLDKPDAYGPLGITQVIKTQIELGWVRALEFLSMLSVYLGLFNLLPLPALDGGRLAFLGYELATRRRPNPKIEAAVHMVGFVALFLLMIVVTFKDIIRFR